MNSSPKVSIVIPVYNGSNYLREAIDSALAQTYKNIEVIVINDGSSDEGKTEAIAKSYGSKIRYFYKKNGGVASALNVGIQMMEGEYFSWLSHDDVYYPHKIEQQMAFLEEKHGKNIVVFCDTQIIDEYSQIIRTSHINPRYLHDKYIKILSTSINGCTLLLPKECFERAGLFNETLKTTQDNEMWIRIAKTGYDFLYLPEHLIKSRRHPGQGNITLKNLQNYERDKFYSWAIKYIENEIPNIYKELAFILIKKLSFIPFIELLKFKFSKIFLRLSKRLLNILPDPAREYVRKIRRIFFNSSRYWERRYAKGGNSGTGSYGKLAQYKSEIINSFAKTNNIQAVIDFGCGDGNQLAYYNIPKYIGLDVSKAAIKHCKHRFKRDESKQFFLYDNKFSNKNNSVKNADLTLSIDVLYHLVKDDVFIKYINDLFFYSNQYVIIYSTNFNRGYASPHQCDREFTPIIEKNIKDFKLIETIINPYKGEKTMSDFFIYKKIK